MFAIIFSFYHNVFLIITLPNSVINGSADALSHLFLKHGINIYTIYIAKGHSLPFPVTSQALN